MDAITEMGQTLKRFADELLGKGQDTKYDYLGLGYAFDSTGARKWGVYRCIENEQWEWYCKSFLDWLKDLIDKKGRLM